jgi:prepilin-type N-terminal cleavage/methylation domain-containing protein
MKKKIQKKPRRGFTLIEILVVSTIIIIVSAMGLVSYSGAQVSARDAQRSQDLENVRTSLLLFRAEQGYYPVAGINLDSRIAFSFPRQIIARLAAAFRVPQALAIVSEPEAIAQTRGTPLPQPSPTPTPTPTPVDEGRQTPTPTPIIRGTPVPVPDTPPEDAIAYDQMMEALVDKEYFTSEEVPLDPINDYTYYYGYNSDGSSFTLTARLEKDGTVLTITN